MKFFLAGILIFISTSAMSAERSFHEVYEQYDERAYNKDHYNQCLLDRLGNASTQMAAALYVELV